jgi:hypothetical protein
MQDEGGVRKSAQGFFDLSPGCRRHVPAAAGMDHDDAASGIRGGKDRAEFRTIERNRGDRRKIHGDLADAGEGAVRTKVRGEESLISRRRLKTFEVSRTSVSWRNERHHARADFARYTARALNLLRAAGRAEEAKRGFNTISIENCE